MESINNDGIGDINVLDVIIPQVRDINWDDTLEVDEANLYWNAGFLTKGKVLKNAVLLNRLKKLVDL